MSTISSRRGGLVVFTDLDGTLLDAETYEAGPSKVALGLCRERGIPVVFVSSKTRAEMERIRTELANEDPFVYENGGGILLPMERWPRHPESVQDHGYWWIRLGVPCQVLCRALREAALVAGAGVIGFDEMSDAEVAETTGLPLEIAGLARKREFDLPFMLLDKGDEVLKRLEKAIASKELTLTRGGRFLHITGRVDKGSAVAVLKSLFRGLAPGIISVAIGDAALDRSMLEAVERPFLVRGPDGSIDEEAWFEGVEVTDGKGPEGFCEVIERIIRG